MNLHELNRGIFLPREDSCFILKLKFGVFAEKCNKLK